MDIDTMGCVIDTLMIILIGCFIFFLCAICIALGVAILAGVF